MLVRMAVITSVLRSAISGKEMALTANRTDASTTLATVKNMSKEEDCSPEVQMCAISELDAKLP